MALQGSAVSGGKRIALAVLTAEERDAFGGFTATGKMPWYSFSIPAEYCQTGSKLRLVDGSTCSDCYACKGNYLRGTVREALERRYRFLADLDTWKVSIAAGIRERFDRLSKRERKALGFFRWHDSGDIQSAAHLAAVCWVAEQLPDVRFWLPTREYGYVREFLRAGGRIPPNLVVRLSAHMVGGPTPARYGLPVSSVHADDGSYPDAYHCPAYRQGGVCGRCRACWDADVEHVSYPLH